MNDAKAATAVIIERGTIMSEQLINRSHCKKFALRYAQETRTGWKPNRVGKSFLDDLDTSVRVAIQKAIQRHPSIGKTIKHYF